MIISCSYHIDWVLKLHLNRDILNAFAAQCSLIITTKSEYSPISRQYNGVNTSTGNFVNSLVIEWIWDRLFVFILLFFIITILIVESEFLDICQAKGFPCCIVFGREPELIGLPTSVDIKLQVLWGEDRLGCGLWVHGYYSQIIYVYIAMNS